MRKCFSILSAILFLFTRSTQAFSEEGAPLPSEGSHKRSHKVLVLIIASDNQQAYLELQKVWRAYMHSDLKHFEVYFIRGNPDLPVPYEIQGDDLFVKTEEGYVPGIAKKTVMSLEAMLPRLKEFDYVLRTNLSSFYVFPRLLHFLDTLPEQRCYCGINQFIPASWIPAFGVTISYVSGAGILISADLAEMLVREKEDLFSCITLLPDDVLLGLFFQNRSIPMRPAGRIDLTTCEEWMAMKENIPENAFHFRAKKSYNIRSPEESFAEEIAIDRELLKLFYPSSIKEEGLVAE